MIMNDLRWVGSGPVGRGGGGGVGHMRGLWGLGPTVHSPEVQGWRLCVEGTIMKLAGSFVGMTTKFLSFSYRAFSCDKKFLPFRKF
jgi:hypothetical protein